MTLYLLSAALSAPLRVVMFEDEQGKFVFFNDTATTEIYTLSLHDALPFSAFTTSAPSPATRRLNVSADVPPTFLWIDARSEEHTSELQSRENLVCRLL